MKTLFLALQPFFIFFLCICASAQYTYVDPYNMQNVNIALVVSPATCSGQVCYNTNSIECRIRQHLNLLNAPVACVSPGTPASSLVSNYDVILEINPLMGSSKITEITNSGGNLILLYNATRDMNGIDGVEIGGLNKSNLTIVDNSDAVRGYPSNATLYSEYNFYEINNAGIFTSIIKSTTSNKAVVATRSYPSSKVAMIGLEFKSDSEPFHAYRILEKAIFWEMNLWGRLKNVNYTKYRYDVPGVSLIVYDPRSTSTFTAQEKYVYDWLQLEIETELMVTEVSEITLMNMTETELIIILNSKRVTSLLSEWKTQNKDLLFLHEGVSDITSILSGNVNSSNIIPDKNLCKETKRIDDNISSNANGEVTYGYPINASLHTQSSGSRYLMDVPSLKAVVIDRNSSGGVFAYYTETGSTSASTSSDIVAYGADITKLSYHGQKFLHRAYEWLRGTLNITQASAAKRFVVPTYGGGEGPIGIENAIYNLLEEFCPGGVSRVELSVTDITDYSSTELAIIPDSRRFASMIPDWVSNGIRIMYVYDGVLDAIDQFGGISFTDNGGRMKISSALSSEITYGYGIGSIIQTGSSCRYDPFISSFNAVVTNASQCSSFGGMNMVCGDIYPLISYYQNSSYRSIAFGFNPVGLGYHDKKLFYRSLYWLLPNPGVCTGSDKGIYGIRNKLSSVNLFVFNKDSLSTEENNLKGLLNDLNKTDSIHYSIMEISDVTSANYSSCDAVISPHSTMIGDYYHDCLLAGNNACDILYDNDVSNYNVSVFLIHESFYNYITSHTSGGVILTADKWKGTGIIDTENTNHTFLTFGYPREAKIQVCGSCGSGSSIGLTWASLPSDFDGLIEADPEELPGSVYTRYVVISNNKTYDPKLVLMGFEPDVYHGETLFKRSVLWLLNKEATAEKTKDIVLIVYNKDSLSANEQLVRNWLIDEFGEGRVSILEVSDVMVADIWGSSRYVSLDRDIVSGVLNYWHNIGYGLVLISEALYDAADALGVTSIGGVDLLSDEYSGKPYGIVKTVHEIAGNSGIDNKFQLASSYNGMYAVTDLKNFTQIVIHANTTGVYDEVLIAGYETLKENILRKIALFGINPSVATEKAKDWAMNAVKWVAATDIEAPGINSFSIMPEEFSSNEAINFSVNVTDNKCIEGVCLGVYSVRVNYTTDVLISNWSTNWLMRSENNTDFWEGSIGPVNGTYILYQIIAVDTTGNTNRTEFLYYGIRDDYTAPVIENVTQTADILLTTENLVLNWDTDEISDSRVYYGKNGTINWIKLTDMAFATSHHINTGTHTQGNYQFYLESCDLQRNCVIEDNDGGYYRFRVGIPLTISNPQPQNGTVFSSDTTFFTLSINTNEPAECRYARMKMGFEDIVKVFNTTDNLTHTAEITGLLENNTYDYYILCRDFSGYVNEEHYHLHYSVSPLDRVSPVVVLISPGNNHINLGGDVTLTYIASDESPISRCYLYTNTTGDWGITLEDSHVLRDTPETFTLNGLSTGVYGWNIKCYDSLNNSGFAVSDFTLVINPWMPGLVIGKGRDCDGNAADNEKFCDQKGIAVDSSGKIYILDTENHRVQVFDANGTFLEKFGGYDDKGIVPGQFDEPEGISLMKPGENVTKIYITDTWNHRVEIRTSNTTFSNATNSTITNISWSEFGERCYLDACDSKTRIYLEYPRGIAVDSYGGIYLADSGNNKVKVISPENKLIREFNGIDTADGKFKLPEGVAVGIDGNIYVADTGNNRIRIFLPNGSQIRSFGGYGSGYGEFDSPSAIALDSNDIVYVADTGNSRIQIFDSLGNYLTKFGTENCSSRIYANSTRSVGQFCRPAGIAVDSARIYVSDTENNRIQIFSKPKFASKKEFKISLRSGLNLISLPVEA